MRLLRLNTLRNSGNMLIGCNLYILTIFSFKEKSEKEKPSQELVLQGFSMLICGPTWFHFIFSKCYNFNRLHHYLISIVMV